VSLVPRKLVFNYIYKIILPKMSCRICLEEDGPFVSPCACKGTTAYIHEGCLNQWIDTSGATECEICKEEFLKEETCSWEPVKYIMSCCACRPTLSTARSLALRMGFTIIGITLILFVSIPVDYFIFMSILVNVSVVTSGVIMQLLIEEDIELYNVLMGWKLCFSIPYACVIVVEYLTLAEGCDAACMSISHICDKRCPYVGRFTREQTKLLHAMFIDVINVLIFICIRATVMCFVHMRSLKFKDRSDEMESLLDHASSSSGTTSSSDSDGSFDRSSSSDILDPATNDRIDSVI